MKKLAIQNILDAYQYRYACKEFKDAIIPDEDFHVILETGRLSPSSLGLEPWKFLVIQNSELRDKIRTISWGAQGQLPTASHFVILLGRAAGDLKPDGDYFVKEMMENTQHLPPDMIQPRIEKIRNYFNDDMEATNVRSIEDWAGKQIYIAMGNMMTTAAFLGIDSCPIEGFHRKKVTDLLKNEGLIDSDHFLPVCMVAFGYRKADPEKPKTRRPMDQVVQWVK